MSARWIDRLECVPASKPAIRDGVEALSYGDLRSQGRRLATVLTREHGTGNAIMVRAVSSASFVRTLLAIMWSGNIPVPIDPALPAPSLEYIRDKSRAVALLEPLGVEDRASEETDRYDATQPALVVFTSGTSGFPKGVIVSDENLRHACAAIAGYLDYPSHPSAAVVLPLFYSYALISQVLCQLSGGGVVRVFGDLRNPLKFAAAVNAEGLETFCGVPSTFHALRAFHALRPLSMPSVRVVCSAGAAMEAELLNTIRTVFPNGRFFNNYGMTEACPRIAFIRDDDPRFSEPTCGRPMAGVEVRIVDPDTWKPVPDGQSGMLVVRGPNITSGYLNDPERTARAFTPDGFLKSGDMAYVDDGYIFIQGRFDDIFNCGGEKIAPLEIERVLNAFPGIEASAVTGVHDAQRGMVPVAFIKCAEALSRQAIVGYLARNISKAKIPLRFIRVSSFPTTANGKVQRRRLTAGDASYVLGELE